MRRTPLAVTCLVAATAAVLCPASPAAGQEPALADRMPLRTPAAMAGALLVMLLDPDGTGQETHVVSLAEEGARSRVLFRSSGRLREPALSRDGARLAFRAESGSGDELRVLDLATGETRALGEGSKPQWSADGTRLLVTHRDPRRLQSRDRLVTLPAHGTPVSAAQPLAEGRIGRWSPDGTRLAVGATGFVGEGYRWLVRTGPEGGPPESTVALEREVTSIRSLDWAPDGRTLLLSVERHGRGELLLVQPGSAQPRRVSPEDLEAGCGCWSPDASEILFRASSPGGHDRLCAVRPDGSGLRVLWQPESASARILGLAWSPPPVRVVAAPPAAAPTAALAPAPLAAPVPAPAPALPEPGGRPTRPVRQPVEPVKVLAARRVAVRREVSPVTVPLNVPGAGDWLISVPVLPAASYRGQRQAVGISVELEDGSLYRGNLLVSRGPWVTLQGRSSGGRVRLIDGKQLSPGEFSFQTGFTLSLAREGADLVLSVNGAEQLRRPLLRAGVRRLSLTLENFDPADATIPLGNVYYRSPG